MREENNYKINFLRSTSRIHQKRERITNQVEAYGQRSRNSAEMKNIRSQNQLEAEILIEKNRSIAKIIMAKGGIKIEKALLELNKSEARLAKKHLENELNSHNNSENYVFYKEDKIVGYIFGRIVLDEFHLYNIGVHKNYHRKGIGSNLIKHIIQNLIIKKINIIYLEVGEKNISAQKFYNSLGFIFNGKRKKYYSKNEDALLFHKDLCIDG